MPGSSNARQGKHPKGLVSVVFLQSSLYVVCEKWDAGYSSKARGGRAPHAMEEFAKEVVALVVIFLRVDPVEDLVVTSISKWFVIGAVKDRSFHNQLV